MGQVMRATRGRANPRLVTEVLKKKLEYAHRILHMEGLAEDSSRGHITARGSDGRFYIKPWGVGFEDVMAEDFQGLDLDMNLLEGKGRVHSELILHLEI
jgi:L-fuculose-phosphate aldolase